MTKIMHLSDLHFGADELNTIPEKKLLRYLTRLYSELGPDTIIVLSGDISFRGKIDGYEKAQRFFEQLINDAGVQKGNFIVCPGNHDIMSGKAFVGFDKFSYALRKDRECTFQDKSGNIFTVGSIQFLVMNSAHHVDKGHGDIDIKTAEDLLERHSRPDCHRIAVTHHHVIPTFQDDRSAICNAYEFMTLLDEFGHLALLHGHQHFTTSLAVGRTPVRLFGVNSSYFSARGIGNGLHVYTVENGTLSADRYTLVVDAVSPDVPGYVKTGSNLT